MTIDSMPLIAWDVDDVLNDLTRQWLAEHQSRSGADFDYSRLSENPPHQLLGIGKDQYLKSLDEFRAGHLNDLEPVAEVKEWFENHGHKYRHLAITAVPLKFAELSAQWVMRHFGKWIRSFNFVPSPRPDDPPLEYETSKAQIINKFSQIDFFIDDNEANMAGIDNVQCLLFPRPWNQNRSLNINKFLHQLSGAIQ